MGKKVYYNSNLISGILENGRILENGEQWSLSTENYIYKIAYYSDENNKISFQVVQIKEPKVGNFLAIYQSNEQSENRFVNYRYIGYIEVDEEVTLLDNNNSMVESVDDYMPKNNLDFTISYDNFSKGNEKINLVLSTKNNENNSLIQLINVGPDTWAALFIPYTSKGGEQIEFFFFATLVNTKQNFSQFLYGSNYNPILTIGTTETNGSFFKKEQSNYFVTMRAQNSRFPLTNNFSDTENTEIALNGYLQNFNNIIRNTSEVEEDFIINNPLTWPLNNTESIIDTSKIYWSIDNKQWYEVQKPIWLKEKMVQGYTIDLMKPGLGVSTSELNTDNCQFFKITDKENEEGFSNNGNIIINCKQKVVVPESQNNSSDFKKVIVYAPINLSIKNNYYAFQVKDTTGIVKNVEIPTDEEDKNSGIIYVFEGEGPENYKYICVLNKDKIEDEYEVMGVLDETLITNNNLSNENITLTEVNSKKILSNVKIEEDEEGIYKISGDYNSKTYTFFTVLDNSLQIKGYSNKEDSIEVNINYPVPKVRRYKIINNKIPTLFLCIGGENDGI